MFTLSFSIDASQVPGPRLLPHDQSSSSSFSTFTSAFALALTSALALIFCWADELPINAVVRAKTDRQAINIFFMMIGFICRRRTSFSTACIYGDYQT